MSGFLEDLTPQQAEELGKFRAAVADIPNKPEDNDRYYLKWLRARKFDVEKAIKMLRNHMAYREEVGVDALLQWSMPQVLTKYYPKGHFGEDRMGHPVWYCNLGNFDYRGILKSVTHEDLLKFTYYMLEKIVKLIKEYSEKNGPHIESVTTILDAEKLSFQRHYSWPGIQLSRQSMGILESNYPEILHRLVIIKAPKVYPLFYNLLKPFIDKRTRDKFVILSDNWQEELQKYISPDQLPQAYGGTRCEPDPWCSDYINHAGDVPPEYFLTNQTETDREEMDRVVVGRGGCCELEYQVELEGSLIRWEFISTGYNISYGLFYRDDSSKKKLKLEPVIPMRKADSHVVPEVGTYTCTAAGKYVVKFDNSYSWTRSKEVYFSIQVLPPNTEPRLPNLATGDEAAAVTIDTDNNSDDEFHDCENT
ncbi:SEC14-like protein 3 isoform X2 [Halichondria panicea]|uniref:SEC14-like protein 3 isoform X2 n=1 Tax=Halichondria panicea TaxID=6063 RepID=UPI00312B78D3